MKTLYFYRVKIKNTVINTLENPITTNEEGIKLNIENMEPDRLYHCVFHDKIFIFYKDHAECLYCYEIGDPKVSEEILKNPEDLEKILESYSNKQE